MIRTGSLALFSALTLSLTACGSSSDQPIPRMEATPAEAPNNPWATYANPEWDHEREEVHKRDSGLEYIVLQAGEACESGPVDSDRAFVHYEGRLTDGKVFDSSLKRGEALNFAANRVIPGWTEALSLMCPGDDWLIYLPSEIAYGERGAGADIKPGDDLIFRVVLLASIPAEDWSGESYR